jgi:hypothetical protein
MVLPFICNSPTIRSKVLESLENHGIETRPFLIGNLLNQPFVKSYMQNAHSGDLIKVVPTPNSDTLDSCGFYIGNNQFIGSIEMKLLEKAISEVRI